MAAPAGSLHEWELKGGRDTTSGEGSPRESGQRDLDERCDLCGRRRDLRGWEPDDGGRQGHGGATFGGGNPRAAAARPPRVGPSGAAAGPLAHGARRERWRRPRGGGEKLELLFFNYQWHGG